ncbi:MAG: hypothetical protein Fur006_65580 [Coleofasciculaceae cyanobacterium]
MSIEALGSKILAFGLGASPYKILDRLTYMFVLPYPSNKLIGELKKKQEYKLASVIAETQKIVLSKLDKKLRGLWQDKPT